MSNNKSNIINNISNKNKGIFFIILSSFSFASMSLFVQLSGDLPFMQKTFFRNIVALVFSLSIIIKNKIGFKFKKENLIFLFLRATFGTMGMILNFYAIENLILSDATMLNKISPFFVIIFSYLILKEKIKMWQVLSIGVAFIGCLFIINPNMILGLITGVKIESDLNNIPALAGLLGAMSAGMAYTMIRLLSNRGENGAFIVFFFSLFSTIVTLPYFVFYHHPMEIIQVVYLLLAGLSASFGQFAITAAYSYAPAKEISVFDYSQIIFSAIFGYFIFGQVPVVTSFIGYGIIIAVAIFMFVMNNRAESNKDK